MARKRKGSFGTIMLALVGVIIVAVGWEEFRSGDAPQVAELGEVTPDWIAIAAWPPQDTSDVEAIPNPNRQMTVIILDDSGSMGEDIEPAKQAVTQALAAMSPSDRVAVVALNRGVILPFTEVQDALPPLERALFPVTADGSTPLTRAVQTARDLLEEEAGVARSFGTYRVIVTTDGMADDPQGLSDAIQDLAASTPIQLATIGIAISGGHVLRRNDLGTFVDVSNVSALREALATAIAENADFAAITTFTEESN